ncbi:MAG: cyclase family protein [Methanobacteriaceae archaeon]|nr:cyclase family protein [Methanobacteriaceae archaeon]MDP3485737.1 cyclase family protein [Methanobacteriaceae archaeon]
MKILDLSQPMVDKMPVFPQDPEFSLEEILNSEKDGFTISLIKTGLHAGTHIDSPYHFYSDGRKIDEITLDELIGPLNLIDVTNSLYKPIDILDTSKDVLKVKKENSNKEINVSELKNIKKGDILIVKTNWSKNWGLSNYFTQNPYLSEEAAEFLIEKEISGLVIDAPSVDTLGKTIIHEKLLLNDIWIVENLKNLELIPQNSENLEFFCIPLSIECEASPVRAFIRINE